MCFKLLFIFNLSIDVSYGNTMEVTKTELRGVRDLCLDYYENETAHIRAIILYGGAAKTYFGHDHIPGDFDLNVFFSKQSNVSSTYGMPENIGEYNGLKVEAMRNKVPDESNIEEYIDTLDSKRWQRIRSEPVVQIYPDIKQLDWGG